MDRNHERLMTMVVPWVTLAVSFICFRILHHEVT